MRNYQYLEQKYIVQTYPFRGVTLIRGEGVYLFDQKGNKYLDFMSNYGVNIFGYNHLKIQEALVNQLKRLTNLHGSFTNDKRAEASAKLIKRCGSTFTRVYWSNSGAETIEAALKFAVLESKKRRFIYCRNAYHGKTLGALSATGNEKHRRPFEPLLWEFTPIEFGNLEELEKTINGDTAALILEPIQGEAGIILPPESYLQKVRNICDKNSVLIILDEIQTGTGRTGTFLASEKSNIQADILCLGKGLAGGLPVGATLVTETVASKIPKSSHTSTFGGNPLTCAGVLAVLDLLDDRLLGHIRDTGTYFLNALKEFRSDIIKDVRGRGLMIGIEIAGKNTPILKALQQRRILAIPAGGKVVRFLPPYTISKKEIALLIDVIQRIPNSLDRENFVGQEI